MKKTKPLRTLEELWAIEDKHPLVDANPAGILRWMFATRRAASNGRIRRAVAAPLKSAD